MSKKTVDWTTGQPQKMQGWFSWRHQTNDAHMEARENYRTRASRRPKQHWDESTKQWVKAASA